MTTVSKKQEALQVLRVLNSRRLIRWALSIVILFIRLLLGRLPLWALRTEVNHIDWDYVKLHHHGLANVPDRYSWNRSTRSCASVAPGLFTNSSLGKKPSTLM